MKNRQNLLVLFIIQLLLITACQSPDMKLQSQFIDPPVAIKKPQELSMHNDVRIDNYYWLNQRDNPEVIEYLNAENEYLKTVMESTEGFQKELYNELISRIKQDDESVPYLDNGYYYYTKYIEGGEYPIYCRKKGSLNGSEEIMLNVNDMAKGYSYFAVSGVSVSPDKKLVAYGVDTVSRRKYTIYVKNISKP